MIRQGYRCLRSLLLLCIGLLSDNCDGAQEREPHGRAIGSRESAEVPSSPTDVPDLKRAKQQFAHFLARAVESVPPDPATYATLAIPECDPDGEQSDALWVASYRVLSVMRSGADLIARAEVVTVAEQHDDTTGADRSVVVPRIRRDTLAWRMRQRPSGSVWRVCGFSDNGYDLRSYGRADLIRYAPPGATRAKLLAQIDSIRGAVEEM